MANVITVWQLDERFPGLLTADMVPAVQAGEACLVSAEIAEYYPTLTAWGELRRTDSEWTPSEAPHLPENTRYIFTSLGKADWDAAYPQCDSDACAQPRSLGKRADTPELSALFVGRNL